MPDCDLADLLKVDIRKYNKCVCSTAAKVIVVWQKSGYSPTLLSSHCEEYAGLCSREPRAGCLDHDSVVGGIDPYQDQ